MITFKKIFTWFCEVYSEATGIVYIVKRKYGKYYMNKSRDGEALTKEVVTSEYMNYSEASDEFDKLLEEDNLYESIYLKRVNLRTGEEMVISSLRW